MRTQELSPAQVEAVRNLARDVETDDGVAAFDEDTLLTLTRPGRPRYLIPGGDGAAQGRDGDTDDADDVLAGFAQVSLDSAEIAVHPQFRRRGLGSALVRTVLADHPMVRLWAHGNLPGARATAAAHDLVVVRELWRMGRPSPQPAQIEPVVVPEDLRIRTFEVGADEDAWLQVNARAFADHPEQGRLDHADLRARQQQDWFDPTTFWLAEDAGSGELLGSMWVKITDDDGARTGEIYALGVDPAAQGRGVGTVLTAVAMDHFARTGPDRLELYVEGDNAAAISTYRRVGFERDAIHVQYTATTSPDRERPATIGP
ncbi:mycothiol synthase [Pseudactinotalea sp. Z1732]|uniref:mycothiol synthase n=1 Tax=Micrococcales TaxID=85006 RepID=UPI003C7C554F